MKTAQDHIESIATELRALSSSRRAALVRKARAFVAAHPGAADHSTFWQSLSARQVIEIAR